MSKSIRELQSCLPSCMMPDGADPCAGYHAAIAKIAELEAGQRKQAVDFAEWLDYGGISSEFEPAYDLFLEWQEA
jgi:hypothetical protein